MISVYWGPADHLINNKKFNIITNNNNNTFEFKTIN